MNNAPRQTRSPLEQVKRQESAPITTRSSSLRRGLTSSDERLLRRLLKEPQDYIDSEKFREPDAEREIFDEAPEIRKPDVSWYHPVMDDLGKERRNAGSQVLLTAAEERVIFYQYNYARFRVREIQEAVWSTPDREPTDEQIAGLLKWKRKAERLREQIANTNLALVLAMAKRTRMSEVDFADLVSEGNMALLRAVDKFDAGRGFKFSTYACRAIIKAFSRQGMKLTKHRQRFPTDFDPKLERSDYLERKREEYEQDAAGELRRIFDQNAAELSDIERTVIDFRFGLEKEITGKPLTLEQIGQIIGVTKERVRQIQNKALVKMRGELESTLLGPTAEDEEEPAHQLN